MKLVMCWDPCKPQPQKAQGLCKPNWNKRPCLKGPLSSYLNKEVEKENPSPGKLHKIFFLKPQSPPTEERVIVAFLVRLWAL